MDDTCWVLKDVLILFEAILGLKVNFNKSMLIDVNIVDSWMREESLVMNCKTRHLLVLIFGDVYWWRFV